MKKIIVGGMVLLLLLTGLSSCGEKTDAPSDTTAAASGETAGVSDTAVEETATDGTDADEPATEPDTKEEETMRPSEIIDGSRIFENGYNANMLVGFDEYGRTVLPTAARRAEKEVGIFYFLWLGTPSHFQDIYDVSEIILQYGKDKVLYEDTPISPLLQPHWWGQPHFGYYNSADEWVIRKHMEMLTVAGVDFLVFDTTNAVTYDSAARRILKVVTELREEGWDAPQVAYMTHTYSISTVNGLYQSIYQKYPEYEEAWYKIDGKPMIIAYTKEKDDIAASGELGPTGQPYRPGDLSEELLDFFHIRDPRWPTDPVTDNGWPYTDWSLPPSVNGDMISVSVATHPRPPFSYGLIWEDWGNYGRGYDVASGKNVKEDILKGTFFDYEWEAVYQNDDKLKYVFITGWNEWVAWKHDLEGYEGYILVDNADLQYSRDIEPMAGGYEDAYYIQMMTHIRRYKYEPLLDTALTLHKTIDVTGAASQWNDVNAIYRRVGQDDGERKKYGASKTVDYACEPVKNNIVEVRVTSDDQNIYFMIRTTEPITDLGDGTSNRMNLFIGRGRPAAGKGWESYEFAVNRTRVGSTATVEVLAPDFSGQKVGDATFSVQGEIMQICVPRAALGLEAGGDFYFKVADGVEDPAEIMSYYSSGRSLPLGRLSYLYQLGE